jgi:ParB family chromosome partitioning protein
MERRNLMTNVTTISLRKLSSWDGNVRKTGADQDLGELAASIEAHGLLQSLIVRKAPRGKFAVIAGRRRLLALQALLEAGKVAADMPVPCIVMDEAANATEVSLAENVIRLPMHPADQFEAFRELIDQGESVSGIAARFGASEDLVEKRLRLGRLSPAILDAFRADEIGLQEAMAFALSDDHAAQDRVFAELTGYARNPRAIRAALTQDEVPATDKRARFIGLEAYEAAGGKVRRDLFDDGNSGYLQDAALLDRLVAENLKAIADELKAEGWKFVDVFVDGDYAALSAYGRRCPERAALSKKAEKQIEKLNRECAKLSEAIEAGEADEDTEDRLAELEAKIDSLSETAESWPAATLAESGVILALSHNGSPEIRRGMVRPEDERAAKAAERKAAKEAAGINPAGALPSKLVADLTANRTAAIRAELARQPDIALAAVVHAFALKAFYRGEFGLSCLELDAKSRELATHMADGKQCKALVCLAADRERLGERLPGEAKDLWQWCLDQDRDTLLELLAHVAALTVDAVRVKDLPWAEDGHADALATALKLDMSAWYVPTAANFFSRVSRKAIVTALEEARGAPQGPALDKMKKAELAERAERVIAGTGWLPAPLRTTNDGAAPAGDTSELPQAAE